MLCVFVGGTGLGASITTEYGINHDFSNGNINYTFNMTASASLGPLTVGGSIVSAKDVNSGSWQGGWSANAGLGIGGNVAANLGVSYSQAGWDWSFGVSGSFTGQELKDMFAKQEDVYLDVPMLRFSDAITPEESYNNNDNATASINDCCGEGFDYRQTRILKDYLNGRISKKNVIDWHQAQFDGMMMGLSFTPIGGIGLALRSAQFGKWAFHSKYLGYYSKFFGRYHSKFLPAGRQGILNSGKLRVGWGVHNGRHVFRGAYGKPGTPIN